jgi:hypothetical protein
MTTTTDNMALVLGTVSETLGPAWASLINAALLLVDAHDHTTGHGVAITPAAIDVNDDLDMQGYGLEDALYAALSQAAAADTAVTGSLQRVGDDLYWVSGAGAAVKLTAGGSVVSSGTGVITATTPSSYPYAAALADKQTVLLVDSSAARTVTLPAATDAMFFMIKDAGGAAATNNVTVTPDGTDTIDGASSYKLDANYMAVGLVSDGVSAWYVV